MNQLELILTEAIKKRATDIHFHSGESCKIRVDNEIIPFESRLVDNLNDLPTGKIFAQILEKMDHLDGIRLQDKFDKGNDVDCAFTCDAGARVRANIYRFEGGLGISLRIIPLVPLTASQINLPFQAVDLKWAKSGMFLVTGANGSGKSTTLAAIIQSINMSRRAHILTIEDPIEYILKGEKSIISQREVGRHTPNFYSALRSSVRENPDVIMIGEMRDLETTRIAIELAETGHLVFASLHTRSASLTIDRLIGQFPGDEQPQIRHMLSSSLIAILSQSLLARKNGGLVAAFELMTTTNAIKNMIRENNTTQIVSSIQTGGKQGMMLMEDSLLRLVENDVVTPQEALSKSINQAEFLEAMKRSPKIDLSTLDNVRFSGV